MTYANFHRPVRSLCLATALACAAIATTPAWAQREDGPARSTQVQFKRGATEATYQGSLRGLEFHSYRFTARKGQVLNVTLDSPSPDVEAVVYSKDSKGVAVDSIDDPLLLQDQVLPHNGGYEVRVMKTRNGARKGGGATSYTLNISIVGATGASAAAPAGSGVQSEVNKANWISYRCQGGQTVKLRYHYGEATAGAQVMLDGSPVALNYSSESTEDMTVFEGDGLKWAIENLPGKRRLQAKSGMLTRADTQVINGQPTPVDEILRKNCDPVR
ncbi:MAG: hypothetical protein Q4G70_07500 [Pseudomonadota bacterium]|nr:hypothetical protein [Pseudomonadota bacterium]